jgi:hypothetical protein
LGPPLEEVILTSHLCAKIWQVIWGAHLSHFSLYARLAVQDLVGEDSPGDPGVSAEGGCGGEEGGYGEEEGYFGSYTHFKIHEEMLKVRQLLYFCSQESR